MSLRCPHCTTTINLEKYREEFTTPSSRPGDPIAEITIGFCPECKNPIVSMVSGVITEHIGLNEYNWRPELDLRIFPFEQAVRKLDDNVPQKYKENYREAERVLQISPKASATLSRYLLQMVLHEELGIKKRTLDDELKALEEKTDIPSALITMLQIMRKIANFGAHPKKSTNSAEIVEVEPHEAEVMLDLLEELFDYVFVKPAKNQEFIEAAKEKYGIEV